MDIVFLQRKSVSYQNWHIVPFLPLFNTPETAKFKEKSNR